MTRPWPAPWSTTWARWDNRPGTNPGYTRTGDILGATTPLAILDALDIPADALNGKISFGQTAARAEDPGAEGKGDIVGSQPQTAGCS